MNTSIDTEVRAALDARRGEWRGISKRSGVSYSWISQFVRHKIPNPGIETLRRLAGELGAKETLPLASEKEAA